MQLIDIPKTHNTTLQGAERVRISELALDTTGIGVWRFDITNKEFQCDLTTQHMMGLTTSVGLTAQALSQLVHPDDLADLANCVRSSLADPQHHMCNVDFRLTNSASHCKWIQMRARVIWHNNQAVEILGSLMDVTDRKLVELALAEKQRVQEIINRISLALNRTLDGNQLARELLAACVSISGAQMGRYYSVTDNDEQSQYKTQHSWGKPTAGFNSLIGSHGMDQTLRLNSIVKGKGKNEHSVGSVLGFPVRGLQGAHGFLLLGHSNTHAFTDQHQETLNAIVQQAAVSLDNARLYEQSQRDIADRQQLIERQTWLMGELSHRVKNILSVIQSVASQTIRTSEDLNTFRDVFIARLQGLSKSHELLTKSNWTGADIRELIELETSLFTDISDQFDISGPAATIPPKAVVSLGMALHELCTNATKYGALSEVSGIVSIRWNVVDDRLFLHWTETGGPAVQPPTRKGFGTKLIDRLLTSDMDGVVDMQFHPDGFVCYMDLDLR